MTNWTGPHTCSLLLLDYLYFPLLKLKNFSAQQLENFLKFSKLTQLWSVGQFLRPVKAFKTMAQVLLSGAVTTPHKIHYRSFNYNFLTLENCQGWAQQMTAKVGSPIANTVGAIDGKCLGHGHFIKSQR